MKKALPWIALAIFALWVFQNPAGAADTIKHLLGAVSTFASHL